MAGPAPYVDIGAIVRGLGANSNERANALHTLTGCRLSVRTLERIEAGKIPKTAIALINLIVRSVKNGVPLEYSTKPEPPINDTE